MGDAARPGSSGPSALPYQPTRSLGSVRVLRYQADTGERAAAELKEKREREEREEQAERMRERLAGAGAASESLEELD
eukprot:354522-Rhodomonas_salina.1